MDTSLLTDERLNVSVQVDGETAPKPHDDEPPYSFSYELRYFFYKGGSSLSQSRSGVPPLFAMVMAGHAQDSATLQASLGFARVFYNTTQIMVIVRSPTTSRSCRLPVAPAARTGCPTTSTARCSSPSSCSRSASSTLRRRADRGARRRAGLRKASASTAG